MASRHPPLACLEPVERIDLSLLAPFQLGTVPYRTVLEEQMMMLVGGHACPWPDDDPFHPSCLFVPVAEAAAPLLVVATVAYYIRYSWSCLGRPLFLSVMYYMSRYGTEILNGLNTDA